MSAKKQKYSEKTVALMETPGCIREMIIEDNERVCEVAELFLENACKGTPDYVTDYVRGLLDLTKGLLDCYKELFSLTE